MSVIEIVPYNPQWPQIFAKEAKAIKNALGVNCIAIHHFGSTSVPGLSAKPKIDILIVVQNFQDINPIHIAALENLGFEDKGRNKIIPTDWYLAKEGNPRIHLHIFEKGNPLIEQNLQFRDWIRSHPEDAKAYVKEKKRLASMYDNGMDYCQAKTDFIMKILKKIEEAQKIAK